MNTPTVLISVAPFAGAWIEIELLPICALVLWSHPSRVRQNMLISLCSLSKSMLHFLSVLVFDNAKILQKCLEILTVFFEILLLGGKNDLLSERVYQNLRLDK